MKILLLEDDPILSEIIVEHLDDYNYVTSAVYDGVEAEKLLFQEKFDLLLLDVNVPLLNGFELLRTFRNTGNMTPAIFITSMNTSQDVLEGFELGANDYLKKPFEMIELKARIDNLKRQFNIDENKLYIITKDISYNFDRNRLFVHNKEIILSKKEGEFLSYLLHKRGELISAEELMINVWSYDTSPSSATIRSYIKILRNYLGEEFISTIRGVGYVFN